VVVGYVVLVRDARAAPDLALDDPNKSFVAVPDFYETARTGLHYIVPVVVLIWCLMVEEMSPGLAAFWGVVAMAAVVLTQRPLTAFFRHESGFAAHSRSAGRIRRRAANGARNMTAVGIATATAGILVGMVTLTGIGLVMTEIVEFLSGGSIVIMLVLVGAICIILGSGLPTTASYVVVATLMAPVVVEIAAENDLAVPLIAVHMFVFYFGLMADVSPPVGLAAYAAAAIAGADPMRVGWQGTWYELRTLLLPFIFIFNPEMLMIDIGGPLHFAVVVGCATLAMMAFVAALQGFFFARNRWWETARAAARLLHAVPSALLDGSGGAAVPRPARRRDHQGDRRDAGGRLAALPRRDHRHFRRSDEQDRAHQARRRRCARPPRRDRDRSRIPSQPTIASVRPGSEAARLKLAPRRQGRVGERSERAAEPVLVRDSGAARARRRRAAPAPAARRSVALAARDPNGGQRVGCTRRRAAVHCASNSAGTHDVRDDDCRKPAQALMARRAEQALAAMEARRR
jgi:hypothetical protein